jgi:hypothetical protein
VKGVAYQAEANQPARRQWRWFRAGNEHQTAGADLFIQQTGKRGIGK